MGPLLAGASDLVTKDMVEAEEDYLPCLSQTHIKLDIHKFMKPDSMHP